MTSAAEVFTVQLARASKKAVRFLRARNMSRTARDDIFAMAMLWCWENREKYSLTTTLETWFMNAVKNAYRAWSRDEVREATELLAEIPTNDTTEQAAVATSSARALVRALRPEYRRVMTLEAEGWTRSEMLALGIPERVISEARIRIRQLRKLLPEPAEYQRVARTFPAPSSEDTQPVSKIDQEIEQLEFSPPEGFDCPPCWRCMWYEGWLPPGHRSTRMQIVEPEVRAAVANTEAEKIRIANEVRNGCV